MGDAHADESKEPPMCPIYRRAAAKIKREAKSIPAQTAARWAEWLGV